MPIEGDPKAADQESGWDYPRLAVAVLCDKRFVIIHSGMTIADTHNAMRALDAGHSPTYYFPQVDVPLSALRPTDGASFCAWKGHARYLDVIVVG